MRNVQRSKALARIIALPRRGPQGIDDLIDPLSNFLMKPGHVCRAKTGPTDLGCAGGFTRLNPLQVQALVEFHDTGGLFLQGPLGCGKTGISVLAPTLLGAKKALLIIPGGGREKTIHDVHVLREHWNIVPFRIESYQKLSREDAENFFFEPPGPYDCIFFDESHYCKNARAAVTRRVKRWRQASGQKVTVVVWRKPANPKPEDPPGLRERVREYDVVVPPAPPTGVASGTPAKRSIVDFAHTVGWAMGPNTPLPIEDDTDLTDWAGALDAAPPERYGPGALTIFSGGKDSLEEVRKGVARRIFETPGCISSALSYVNAKLLITLRDVPLAKVEDDWFRVLRGDPEGPTDANGDLVYPGWTTPAGDIFTEASELWRHACSMGLGYYTIWDPAAPADWRKKRYRWHAGVREILADTQTVDTVAQVATAVDSGKYPHLRQILVDWRNIEPTFKPNSVARWVGDTALGYAAEWLKGGGIVWTGHTHFGRELARRTGCPYFGEEGLTDDARHSIVYTKAKAIIASVQANGVMHNLQRYDRNLIASIWPAGYVVEQCIGRTHRQGQLSPVVTVDWMVSCREQLNGFEKASGADSTFYRDLLTMPARLCYGEICSEKITTSGWAFSEQEH